MESANLKLVRAQEHILAIREINEDYTEREPDKIIKHPDGSHELKFIESPPHTISVLAGECIYQIRSALDHLAFQLVRLNRGGETLPPDWEGKCAFPLWVRPPEKTPAFNCFKGTIPGITLQAYTFIESVQPYNRGDVNAYLGRLAILSNIDKHRHLHVTKPQANRRDEATIRCKGMVMNTSSVMRVEEGRTTKQDYDFPDTEVLSVQVSGAFHPFVSFDEPTVDPGVLAFPVADLLQACLDGVQRIIIPEFTEFLK